MSTFRLAEITIDCRDPARVAQFWTALLGGEVDTPMAGWRRLVPAGGGPDINFQPVPEEKSGKARLHLDIETDDIATGLARVLEFGGRDLGERHDYDEGIVLVVADPEGTEFCLVQHY